MEHHRSESEYPRLTSLQIRSVGETLQAVLESKYFRKSQRYPAFLTTIVNHTLAGEFDRLEERELGIEIFGRSPDWDTSNDSIVRNAAMEIRKRLASYFLDHPQAEVRIELPALSYVPEFKFGIVATAIEAVIESPSQQLTVSSYSPQQVVVRQSWNSPWLVGLTLSILLAICAWAWNYYHTRHQEDFWSPVFRKSAAAVIVVGSNPVKSPFASDLHTSNTGSQMAKTSDLQNPLKIGDTVPIAKICGVFRERQRDCNIVQADQVLIPALHNSSLVLIGSFNNALTSQFMGALRYQIRKMPLVASSSPDHGGVEIVDTFHADQSSKWKFDGGRSAPASEDYAIIARFHSDITDSMVVMLAGLTPAGTRSAGEILASNEAMQQFLDEAPKDWKGLNFEVVLHVGNIQDAPTKPNVVAAHFW